MTDGFGGVVSSEQFGLDEFAVLDTLRWNLEFHFYRNAVHSNGELQANCV